MTSEMDIDAIVAEAARQVVAKYVFREVGERVGAHLRERAAAGHYAAAPSAAELAPLVTADLQATNGDRHLRLKYHADEIPDLPSTEMVTAMIRTQAAASLGGVARVERLPGNVAWLELGPLLFPPRMAAGAVGGALQLVAAADALVLDLRNTVGGDPAMVAFVCTYLFDEPVHLIDIYERDGDRTFPSWTLPLVPGDRFGGTKPVYVLTSATTFSGGEELAYDLQQHGRATIVGERTGGGAHPRVGVRLHPHLELTVPTGRASHPVTGENWEGVGVTPDIAVPAADALAAALAAHAARVAPVVPTAA
jgi:hypothetical protein